MSSVNKAIIVGHLGQDPEIRTFQNGGKIANVSIATTDRWTDKQTGEQREAVEWHRITFSDRLADIVAQYLRKGSQVYVEGSIKTRKWQDQNGQDRYATEIRATSMQMLGSRTDGGQQPQQHAPQPQNGYPQGYGQAPQQGYQGQQYAQQAPQGYPQPQNGGYAPPHPPQGQAQSQPPQGQQGQTWTAQQPNGYNRGFAHPSEVGYQNDGYGNLVPIQNAPTPSPTAPSGQISDDDMPF